MFETTSGGNGSRSMKLVEDPAEQTTAVTDIILALVAFGGVLLLQWSPVNTGELWRINIWSMALGLVGLAAALGTVAHGLFLKTTFLILKCFVKSWRYMVRNLWHAMCT